MRITTRIAAGLFLIAALLIGALTYQLSQVDRLQQVNLELSRTNLEAARISVLLIQGFEGVREFAAKTSAYRISGLGDDEYRQPWIEWEGAVDAALLRLADLSLEGEEARIRARVQVGWREYRATAPALRLDPSRLGEVDAMLLVLRGEVERLIAVNEATVAQRADVSAAAGERARIVARASAGASLALAGIASLLLFFSISGPLRRLTRGTRELAVGRFDHRLEVRGPAELAGLARDFNEMAERLNELEDLKRDFVSHVSHELKNPLAAVQETVEILLDELPGPLTQKQRHLLELARRSSGRLSSMIGDLLDVSRIEAGGANYRVASHDAVEIVRAVLEELQPVAEEKDRRLAVTGAPDVRLLCDEERVREVVANLVGNAIKFSPEGSRVDLELSECPEPPTNLPEWYASPLASETGPFLLVSVSDQGIGVPDEHKARIFDKFHQVAGRQRIQGQGVGLGLAISRRVVEAHGGAIWVEDRAGGGSVFYVLLPVAPRRWHGLTATDAPTRAEAEAGPTAPPGSRGSVATRVTVPILAFVVLPSCAIVGGGSGPNPVSPDPPGEALEEVPHVPDPAPTPAWTIRLDRGRALLAARSFSDAVDEFESALQLGAEGEALVEAHWGLALIYMTPASPLRDRAQALTHLDMVEHETSNGLVQAQAAWARSMLEQIAALEGQVQERDDLLRQLNEALEMLRRIDLDRRPSGGGAPGLFQEEGLP